jgi:hypothetical protein
MADINRKSRIPTWYTLRGIGSSKFSKMTILMPVIGYLIIFNTQLAQFMSVSADLIGVDQNISEMISNRNLYFLYFGLLIFSISNILYHVFCPSIIKLFISEYEFYSSENNIITTARYKELLSALATKFNYIPTREIKNSLEPFDSAEGVNSGNRERWLKTNSDLIMETLNVTYKYLNEEKILVRICITGGYLVSVILISVPTAIICFKIIQNIIPSLNNFFA